MLQLPPEFISTITNTFGADGERFIADLPSLVEEACARWELRDVQPVENLSYNFVAFAESPSPSGRGVRGEGECPSTAALRASAQDVVLKIGVPRDELTSEMAALKLFNGEGACRLMDCDEERGFLLLERLRPGEMLAEMEDDDEATRIAAEVMRRIWRRFDYGATNTPLRSARSKFIFLSDWFDGLKRLREMFNGGTGPLDETLVARVERVVKDFFAENHMPVLMHGDFHHFNILGSTVFNGKPKTSAAKFRESARIFLINSRKFVEFAATGSIECCSSRQKRESHILLSERGWLVIDPKGVIGPACYEVGPFMMNPWGMLPTGNSLKVRIRRRIDILHEQLEFERERILEWSLAHAVLSAWWGIEDNTGWEYSKEFAELIASL